MKVAPVFVSLVAAAQLRVSESPVTRVVQLIKGLRDGIEADGEKEQKIYDKFACWCEDTTARKAAAIDAAKDEIVELSKAIVQAKGTVATLTADLKQVKIDIADNIKSTEEATALRAKEKAEYERVKANTEQARDGCKKAMEVLAPAGKGKEASTLQEAQTLSVVGGVRSALNRLPADSLDADQLATIKAFVADPMAALGAKKNAAAFLQVSKNNPFGEYAPQSTQIQGILSSMHDTFIQNLKDMIEEEKQKVASFEELMETKRQELDSLTATEVNKTESLGAAKKQLADDKTTRADTEAQLKEDEKFFADTKAQCQMRADDWAERTRLRTEELGGIAQALKTLDSPEARATFESSATTMFVQFNSQAIKKEKALQAIKALSQKTGSLRLAALFSKVKLGTSGHFDAVIAEIDKMITTLRQEEKDDMAHRDRCEKMDNNLQASKDSLAHDIKKAEAKSERLESKSAALQAEIEKTIDEILETQKAMAEALANRNAEHDEYIQAMKDDQAAVSLLAKAISQMSAFYTNNDKLLLQKQPSYSEDPDAAPAALDGNYGGRKSESTGVLAILEMIKEDVQKEMGEAKKAEADATKEFGELRSANTQTEEALNQKKISLSQQKADTDQTNTQTEKLISGKKESMGATAEEKEALKADCDWIRTSFDARREKRAVELDGLQVAKSSLLGAGYEPEM
jgi:hypothetical protein